jgi:hypothetical protein
MKDYIGYDGEGNKYSVFFMCARRLVEITIEYKDVKRLPLQFNIPLDVFYAMMENYNAVSNG